MLYSRRGVAEHMKSSHECIECAIVITNPLCSFCLTAQMKQVVGEVDRALATQIEPCHVEGGARCLGCSRGMALCAHCFSKDIYFYIKENNPDLAKEFLARFDFELRQAVV